MFTKTKSLYQFVLALLVAVSFTLSMGNPALAMEDPHLHVLIDIKPGSYPNSINLRSQGKIPVALFGSAEFDVASVDVSTVKFGPMEHQDIGAPVVRYSFEDVNGDGYSDIIFHFNTQETGLTSADTMACLHGMTDDGTHFCGHDSVNIIP